MSRPTSVPARLAVFALCASLAGCAAGTALRTGRLAEQRQDYDRAVVEYTKVLQSHPDNKEARAALTRARLRASQDHFTQGRRLAGLGKLEEALVEYQLASQMNPASADIEQALRAVRNQLRVKISVAREGKTELQALIDRARSMPVPGLDLPDAGPLPGSLVFRSASSRDVLTALARFARVNIVFDPAFRDSSISVDFRDSTFEQALASIAASTQTFFRTTAARTITVVPDTPAKRREYEQEIVQTFYLSNADLKETIDLLRVVIDTRRIAAIASTNAITIQDTPERIAAAGRLLAAIDKARPEVIIDVELLEVDRSRLQEYGLQVASPGSTGISGSASVNRDDLTLQDLRNLTSSQVFMASVPGLYYRLLKSDSATRTLANPQLRTSEGMAAQARFGERVPVPVTTFSPIATGGVAQQPITSFNYENIGVNIDITPRTHHDDEVTLALKVEVSSISGTGYGGLPTFGNRSINTVIRLKDGETSLLAGLIRDEERRTVQGVPGLSDIPVLGRLFAHTRSDTLESDVILTLTPHIIRVLDLTEDDLRPFRIGRDAGGAVVELPLQVEPSRPPAQPPAAPPKPAAPLLAPPPSQN